MAPRYSPEGSVLKLIVNVDTKITSISILSKLINVVLSEFEIDVTRQYQDEIFVKSDWDSSKFGVRPKFGCKVTPLILKLLDAYRKYKHENEKSLQQSLEVHF